MRHIGTLLALTSLALVAAAQNRDDVGSCQSLSSASRTRSSECSDSDEEKSVERSEIEFTIKIDRPPIQLAQCQANLAIDYVQIGAIASVDGVIENETCAASNGEYTIRARIRDENGETTTLNFPETWQRDDDQPVNFTAEYPIGENVELVNVRSRGLRCECVEPEEEPEPTPGQ